MRSVPPGHQVWLARMYPYLKRAFDFTAALILLILLVPLFAVIALAVRLDSPGPVFFIQRRVGYRGRVFNFYKFRSMTNGQDHSQTHRQFAEAYIKGQGLTIWRMSRAGPSISRRPMATRSRGWAAGCVARASMNCRSWSTSSRAI